MSDPSSGREIVRLTAPGMDRVNGLAFTPDGKTLVSAGNDGKARLWSLASGKERLLLDPDLWQGGCLALSANGKRLAFGTNANTIVQWDLATGRRLFADVAGQNGPVLSVSFDRDGRTLAAADHTRGHGTFTLALAFSPDGSRLASGLLDTTVLLWNTRSTARTASPAGVDNAELANLWANLAGKDSATAYRAIARLIQAPASTLPHLRDRLKPAPRFSSPATIRKLLNDLDSKGFVIRNDAYQRLEELNEQIEPFLREELAKNPALERRRRLEKLLEGIGFVRSSEALRRIRAIQVLERIGTPAAVDVLRSLSRGEPQARETQDAVAALGRLAERK